MSAHVLLNLLNELGKKMRGCAEHLIGFPQRVKFNNTGARMQDNTMIILSLLIQNCL